MEFKKALLLVKKKYRQELKGIKKGVIAVEYTDRCEQYPVLMAVALRVLATEIIAEKTE